MSDEHLATPITGQQCKQILRKYNEDHETDLKLLSYSVMAAEEAKGFLGEYYHLNVLCRSLSTVPDVEVRFSNNFIQIKA